MRLFRNRLHIEQTAGHFAPASRGRSRLVPTLLIALAAIAYLVPIGLFLNERHGNRTSADTSHDVSLELKITVADFAKGVVTFHAIPVGGTLLKPNGRLQSEVAIETDPGTGPVTHTFKPDMPLTPWVINVTPDTGDILDYPFDRYTLELEFNASSGDKPLSIHTELDDVPHGYRAHAEETSSQAGQSAVQVFVSRTPTMIFVALLSTLSLLLVTMAACAVAWQVAYRGRRIEFSMMVWVAALLFVIPTVRNALPGSIPAGALIDFVVFFWLQIAVVVSMTSLVLTWLRRPPA